MDNNGQQSAVLHASLMTFFLVFHGILGHCMVLYGVVAWYCKIPHGVSLYSRELHG